MLLTPFNRYVYFKMREINMYQSLLDFKIWVRIFYVEKQRSGTFALTVCGRFRKIHSSKHQTRLDTGSQTLLIIRFWEIEALTSSKPSLLPEDFRCEQLFNENWTRLGKYSIIFRERISKRFFRQARRRFRSLELHIKLNPKSSVLRIFTGVYRSRPHVSRELSIPQFSLPHHCGIISSWS